MTAPVSAQAMENNQRLFFRYAKVFKENDIAPYAIHAHKLAAWLRDSKAYYTAARPEVSLFTFSVTFLCAQKEQTSDYQALARNKSTLNLRLYSEFFVDRPNIPQASAWG